MSFRPPAAIAAVAAVAALALTACGQSGSSQPAHAKASSAAYTIVTTGKLEPGQAVPAPVGKPILTLSGAIAHTNVGSTLQFDMATLERLGVVRYSVDDRQAEGHVVMFSGVLVSRLLQVAGVSRSATTLHTIALNDYKVNIPLSDITKFPVLLATKADGKRMSVAHYGPLRFIYPTSSYKLPASVYDPRWIWQLQRIEVR